jgi:uncharacterized glyoxalase superfamily protein PhnB
MFANRSMPESVVIPELAYRDVAEAVAWLCGAFGFKERLRIGDHRAQLSLGTGSVIVTRQERTGTREEAPATERRSPRGAAPSYSIMVRIEDVNLHHQHAVQHGARIVRPPADHPFGERQYTAEDPAGHVWTFSQTLADVDPAAWGGTPSSDAAS